MYHLVVTENPSVAMDVEGGGLLISWCAGHLAELADAETYDPKYAK